MPKRKSNLSDKKRLKKSRSDRVASSLHSLGPTAIDRLAAKYQIRNLSVAVANGRLKVAYLSELRAKQKELQDHSGKGKAKSAVQVPREFKNQPFLVSRFCVP